MEGMRQLHKQQECQGRTISRKTLCIWRKKLGQSQNLRQWCGKLEGCRQISSAVAFAKLVWEWGWGVVSVPLPASLTGEEAGGPPPKGWPHFQQSRLQGLVGVRSGGAECPEKWLQKAPCAPSAGSLAAPKADSL